MGLRLEAGLQGAKKATLGSDESAEIWGDRVVTDGISRPMATDGKGEEHSPMNLLSHERRKSTKYFVASGAEVMRCEQDDNLSAMEGEEVRINWSLKSFKEEVKFKESCG